MQTITDARFLPAPRFFLFGDKGDGWQLLGKTVTAPEADRLQGELAWVYRLELEAIEILEAEDD